MASIYRRGRRLWCRVKDESGKWTSEPTPYSVGQELEAREYAAEGQQVCDERRGAGLEAPLTVRTYAEKWIKERRERGVRSAGDEETRLRKHALPHLGDILLAEVRPRHVRDMVRALRKAGTMAPRSIRHAYGTCGTMFRDAVVDELIKASPCVLKRGELPPKVDKDPEWRAEAMFATSEVERLISDSDLPVERRVLYALKAIAGLRHGEAVGLRWRHYDPTMEPLGRLVIATSYDTGRTKTDVTRRVPVHPALAKILASWKLSHWERIYGRQPTADDLVVPTRTMKTIDKVDSIRAMKEDLLGLGLRVEAGQGGRNRGGHDLRSWFITTCQEHGAHRDLLRVVTHTAKGDVMSGYTRATWGALCAEVAKLRISAEPLGEVLPLATGLATAEIKAAKRWRKVVTPPGLEGDSGAARTRSNAPSGRDGESAGNPIASIQSDPVASLATALAEAVLAGQEGRARQLATMLLGLAVQAG